MGNVCTEMWFTTLPREEVSIMEGVKLKRDWSSLCGSLSESRVTYVMFCAVH
jgi:hypothetical protein